MSLFTGLNDRQAEAVRKTEGPVLILAGAGTGKTRVITHRIAHLIDKKVPAKNILAVTFTNKAADEMRERAQKIVGPKKSEGLTISTFHSLCLNILREKINHLGFRRDFVICDASDQFSLVRKSLREVRVGDNEFNPVMVHSRISLLKNGNVSPDELDKEIGDDFEDAVALSYRKYQDALQRQNLLDFDDLLLYTLRLFAKNKNILEEYRKRFRYIMVDEYQDTNEVQFRIVRELAGKNGNLCVVGDDDQSIYGWRGADVSNILMFEKHFKNTHSITLDCNYRSTNAILETANVLIKNNFKRKEKKLWSKLGPGEKPRLLIAADPEEEAYRIVKNIVTRSQQHKEPLGDHAIIFRTNAQSRAFEEALREASVPYVLIGGMKFFDRREVRDLLAYLKVLVNPADEVSLARIINYPPRGIGDSTVDKIQASATEHKCEMFDALEKYPPADVPPAATAGMQNFVSLIKDFQERFKKLRLQEALKELVEKLDLKEYLKQTSEDEAEAQRRLANIDEFFSTVAAFASRNKRATLEGFLERITLLNETDDDNNPRSGAVTLITLHSCKGMEFPHVYLPGFEEGLLPHERSIADGGGDVDEERRLAYVGITRAQKKLVISFSLKRRKFGKDILSKPSRFLSEIPPEMFEQVPPSPQAQVAMQDIKAEEKAAEKKKAKRKKRARKNPKAK